MLEHAVVGIDHSPATDPLLEQLRQLPRLGVRRVTLVTVLGGHYPQAPEVRHRGHYRALLEEMATHLDELDVSVEVRTGHPSQELRYAAAESSADLLVAGSHGHTPWRDLFLGSTVLDLVRTSTVPILLLPLGPPTSTRGGGVLLATDGSRNAADAEQLAITLGRKLGGTAVTVLTEHDEGDVDEAATHLEQLVTDSPLEPHVDRGPLPEVIGRLAEQQAADVVVVGSRGRNPLTGLLLGSTAEHLLRTARRPVLLVPTPR
jgi:nucleotide-binding universal stress UspA family protein